MASPLRNQFYSGGGAIFIGDGNAGRDIINISRITTVRPFARSLHRSFFSSSKQFTLLQSDLATLMSMLEAIMEDGPGFGIDCDNEPALCNLSRSCYGILNDLQELKQHFDSVGTQTRITWEREQWRAEEFAEIRSRLTATTSSLNMAYSKLIHSSTKMIMEKLDTFINEVQTGKREGSVVTNHTTDSLSADEKEAWRQLRKELESVGITPALFNQHRELIIERLLKAINDGDLAEDIGEELSDTTSGTTRDSTEERLDTDPTYRHGDLAEDPGDEHSGRTQGSTEARLATADLTYETTPKAGTRRTKTSPANPSAIRWIKGPSRIMKLLFRVTNSSILTAAHQGNEGLVQKFLQRGVDADSAGWNSWRPLLLAAINGHETVVRLLLETGKVDVDLKDRRGRTPLNWAAMNKHEAVVKLLAQSSPHPPP